VTLPWIKFRRLPLLVVAALSVAACSEIDCTAPQRYHGAQLEKRLETPDGLSPAQVTDDHVIPGGPPPADYGAGACLVKPPQVVAPPPDSD